MWEGSRWVLWEGGETRLGKTTWQAVDATVFSVASTTILKRVFTRARPSETDDPNRFFQGDSHTSFPSGEVAAMSAIVTPFVLEYRHETPGVYALELLPLYDAVARVKARGHWQSDVIVGFGVGTLAGYYAHNREQPFFLELLPHGVAIGLRKRWLRGLGIDWDNAPWKAGIRCRPEAVIGRQW